jgi:RNA ligase (TIGR02306 family)
MSDIRVTAVTIDAVEKHPNADRLDLATIGGYTVVVGRDEFQPGDVVAYFPPDIVIPPGVAENLGVAKYLKSSVYPGTTQKSNCRVAAARLRGVPSFGFVFKLKNLTVGDDLTNRFQAVKYEPPEPLWWNVSGDAAPGEPAFHVYTDIENYRNPRYRGAFETGTPVRVTEKIHGTNSRVALINGNYMCGSHQVNKKEFDTHDRRSMYWAPLTEDMKALLWYFAETYGPNVIAFGEIFGSKIQYMDYGVEGSSGYRLFDVSVNGRYIDWFELEAACKRFCISTVPLLYVGPFYPELVDSLVDGPTTFVAAEEIKSGFKGREGVVITPLSEGYSDVLGGRLIMKAVSCDYLAARKSDSH